jgi:hypothetical protein
MEKLIERRTPAEYFKELVEKALERQRVPSSELSSFYLVQLLESFVHQEGVFARAGVDRETPVAHIVCQAMQSQAGRQLALFKFSGDLSLFVSGFFSDSLHRQLVDVDYYASLGGFSYRRAARLSGEPATAEIFAELAAKFSRFVDVLNEVSETSQLTNNLSLLRLYEKWLRTGSERSATMLREQGVLPVSGCKRVH